MLCKVKKTKNFTVMSNHHLRNMNLSLKARGLLSQMLSLPDNWDYTIRGLSKINKDGEDSIKSAIQELVKEGYVIRKQEKENGKFGKMIYVIYEEPFNDSKPNKNDGISDFSNKESNLTQENTGFIPSGDFPLTEKPLTEKPTAENPRQINKDILNTNIKNKDILNKDLVSDKWMDAESLNSNDNNSPTPITEYQPITKDQFLDFYLESGLQSIFVLDGDLSLFAEENIRRYRDKNKTKITARDFADYKKYAISCYKKTKEKTSLIR